MAGAPGPGPGQEVLFIAWKGLMLAKKTLPSKTFQVLGDIQTSGTHTPYLPY
jgi:hypothetical protein